MSARGTTNDPDLRLLVDGRIIRPAAQTGWTYRFDIAGAAFETRIVSRSVVPASLDPAMQDQRRLGVSLLSLAFRSPDLDLLVRADDPSLEEGFHAPEAGHRWTNGRAAIPAGLVQCFPGAFSVEIRINEPRLRYPLI